MKYYSTDSQKLVIMYHEPTNTYLTTLRNDQKHEQKFCTVEITESDAKKTISKFDMEESE